MRKAKSLYQKAKNSPKSTKLSELEKLLEFAGFVLRDRQSGGSHKQYKREKDPSILMTIQPRKGEKKMANPYQVRDLLKYIDEHDLLGMEKDNE